MVRLGSDADPAHGRLCGRVEHVQSGRRARIESVAELQDFVRRVLADEGRESGQDPPMGPAVSRPEEER